MRNFLVVVMWEFVLICIVATFGYLHNNIVAQAAAISVFLLFGIGIIHDIAIQE